jgi:hypothetical protein
MKLPTGAARAVRRSLAAAGATLLVLIGTGVVLDVTAFDRTRGGYEPPYTGYSGTPVDWDTLDVTATGMARRGHVVNVLVDCSSGMMSFEVLRLEIPFREFSPRALAVHRPREACERRGFTPEF